MANPKSRQQQIFDRLLQIECSISTLNEKLRVLRDERDTLLLEQCRLTHPCACVKLGKDIGIMDMQDLQLAGRVGFGAGLVAYTLSALKSCPSCKGTGKPAHG